jgi:ssDNA-specific exonuclease RecJ
MIDELQKAFALAAQQSEQEQAAIAVRIREMIKADTRWDALLSDPESVDMLEELAEEAHQEYLRGETEEIGPQPDEDTLR